MQFNKPIFRLTFLFGLTLILAQCQKDEEQIKENPIFQFFSDTAIQIDTVSQAADTWDYGFAFRPVKSGEIGQLAMKLPREGDFTVTLWDLNGNSPVVITSQNLSSGSAHQTAFQDISRIKVEKDKKYGISILANTFYRVTKTGGEAFDFPRVIGNIEVDAFHEAINTTGLASFPDETNNTRLAPCVDVIFIAD